MFWTRPLRPRARARARTSSRLSKASLLFERGAWRLGLAAFALFPGKELDLRTTDSMVPPTEKHQQRPHTMHTRSSTKISQVWSITLSKGDVTPSASSGRLERARAYDRARKQAHHPHWRNPTRVLGPQFLLKHSQECHLLKSFTLAISSPNISSHKIYFVSTRTFPVLLSFS